jgi:hypothetical protein
MAMALRMNSKHRNPFGYSGITCIKVTTLQTWLHSTGSEEAEGSDVHTWAGILGLDECNWTAVGRWREFQLAFFVSIGLQPCIHAVATRYTTNKTCCAWILVLPINSVIPKEASEEKISPRVQTTFLFALCEIMY